MAAILVSGRKRPLNTPDPTEPALPEETTMLRAITATEITPATPIRVDPSQLQLQTRSIDITPLHDQLLAAA